MTRVLDQASALDLSDEDKTELRLAALLHDVGHYPYSHLMETVGNVVLTEEFIEKPPQSAKQELKPAAYPDHEALGRLIVTEQSDMLKALGDKERAERIADLFTRSKAKTAKHSLLIHSSLDMDRLDYLVRDSQFAGVPYGQIDLNYLLQNVRANQTGLIGVSHKAMAAAEQFLLARFFMHRAVYYHKTTFGLEEAFRQLLRRCRDKKAHEVPADGDRVREIARGNELIEFTDSFLDRIAGKAMSDSDPVIKALAKAIVFRHPPKLLREEYSLVDLTNTDSQKYNACTHLRERCKSLLADLATRHGVQLGLFLLAEPKPLQLDKRGAVIRAADAEQAAKKIREVTDEPEKEEEMIKVFERDADEPKSLVDIPSSLLNACGHRSFRMVRLYVVEDNMDKVARLRSDVATW